MPPTIDPSDTLRILCDLVRINSTNPSLNPHNAGEAEIAAYIAAEMKGAGLDVNRHEHAPGRVSVVAQLTGTGGGRSLMLNGHSDTVGVEGMEAPFSAEVRDGKLYGRGAEDMKGSLAACMAAVKSLAVLARSGTRLRGDVLLAAVADEECASMGSQGIIPLYPVDGAIVTEPTNLSICLGHKGFLWLEVEVIGRAAHGSRYQEGIDANMRMGRVLARLEQLERELRGRSPHPLTGPPSLHASRIEGGTEWSMYAARCTLQLERRLIPGESVEAATAEVQAILDTLASEDTSFQATLTTRLVRLPHVIAPEAPLVQSLLGAAQRVLGHTPAFTGHTGWMDSALLAAAGVESVVMGATGGGLHTSEEWVEVDSVTALARVLAETASDYCR